MPKLQNLYWICGRCGWRGKRPPTDKLKERRVYTQDPTSGDLIYHPPKDACPRCGSRYNLRYIWDSTVPRGDKVFATREGEYVGNCDPWTGREMEVELAAAAARH